MDRERFSAIAHRRHPYCSPLSQATVDLLLAAADLTPGARVVDLGCGSAGMALRLAEAHGARVEAVERSAPMADLAAARLAGRGSPGHVTLHRTDAAAFLARMERSCRLLLAIGSGGLVPGAEQPAEILRELAQHVTPGGHLLWGEGYWRCEPSEAYLAGLGAARASMGSHVDNVAAGEAAGLEPVLALTSTRREWDEYEWTYAASVREHLRHHPDDPDTPAMRARIDAWQRLYLTKGRDTLGFGCYLFRRP